MGNHYHLQNDGARHRVFTGTLGELSLLERDTQQKKYVALVNHAGQREPGEQTLSFQQKAVSRCALPLVKPSQKLEAKEMVDTILRCQSAWVWHRVAVSWVWIYKGKWKYQLTYYIVLSLKMTVYLFIHINW